MRDKPKAVAAPSKGSGPGTGDDLVSHVAITLSSRVAEKVSGSKVKDWVKVREDILGVNVPWLDVDAPPVLENCGFGLRPVAVTFV